MTGELKKSAVQVAQLEEAVTRIEQEKAEAAQLDQLLERPKRKENLRKTTKTPKEKLGKPPPQKTYKKRLNAT